jgi:carboxylesterase
MPTTPAPRLIPTAEPFFFPGNPNGKAQHPVGCLLVHGFTGSPKEMRWMGEYLAHDGHTVIGVRLAGHATRPEDMLRTRWPDWLASVEEGYRLLESYLCVEPHNDNHTPPSIFAMGLSMGGVLSLILASQAYQPAYPLAGVVGISTPYTLRPDWRMQYLELLHYFKPNIDKGEPDWHYPQAALDHVDYPTYPTRSVAELRDLLEVLRSVLPSVKAPTLLVHSKDDRGVLPDNMPQIFQHLGSQQKEMFWVENSGHVVVREPPRQIVFERVIHFIEAVVNTSV